MLLCMTHYQCAICPLLASRHSCTSVIYWNLTTRWSHQISLHMLYTEHQLDCYIYPTALFNQQVQKEQMVGLDLYPAQLICIVIGDMSMKSDGLSKWKLEKRDHLEINSIYMILFYVVKTINRWHCQKKSILPAANTQTYEADLVILRVL